MIKIKSFPYLLGSLRICLRASSPVRSGAQERSGELARRLNSESWYYSNFPKSDFRLFHSGVLSSSSPVVFFLSLLTFFKTIDGCESTNQTGLQIFFLTGIITFIRLSPRAGKMEQILCSDWLQDRPTPFARDQSRFVPQEKIWFLSHW